MGVTTLRLSERFRDFNWTVAGIFGLFIITALATIPLTLTVLQNRSSDAHLIDMVGRQRMLLERYMKEVLLASQGVSTGHERTRAVLHERLKALLDGGPTVAHIDRGEIEALPAAPTQEIRVKLIEQQRLLEAFMAKADAFLRLRPSAQEYATVRDDLVRDNAVLLEHANDAVALFARHSDARTHALILWEIIAVLLVVTVAALRTWRFVQAEREVKASQAVALEALRQNYAVKSALLSSVSHELRTPLTAIKSMVFGLGDDSGVSPNHVRKEFLRGIDHELDYLNSLVGNLLDMSRLESGTLLPQREWHLLDELVEGAIRRVESVLGHRPLQVVLPPEVPPIYVDGVQIQQVLVNLLDNAIKFSPLGSPIRLEASVLAEMVEIRVVNTGEGVMPDELDRIFERFYRGQSAKAFARPGTGLGLAICKGIVDAHGGRIFAASTPGGDTTIQFRLPVNPPVSLSGGVLSDAARMQRIP